MKPVPPRIRMRIGFTDRPAVVNRSLEFSSAAEANESDRKLSAPPAKAESFRNVLRSVVIDRLSGPQNREANHPVIVRCDEVCNQ